MENFWIPAFAGMTEAKCVTSATKNKAHLSFKDKFNQGSSAQVSRLLAAKAFCVAFMHDFVTSWVRFPRKAKERTFRPEPNPLVAQWAKATFTHGRP